MWALSHKGADPVSEKKAPRPTPAQPQPSPVKGDENKGWKIESPPPPPPPSKEE